jgi:glutamine amidotransferase
MTKTKVYIINYESGNLYSVQRAIKMIGYEPLIISEPELLKNADKVIIPGVGSFNQGISNLKKKYFDQAIFEYVKTGKDLLGICLGMQLFMNQSSEFGKNKGLGLINGTVKNLDFKANTPVPHIGWNNISITKNDSKFLNKISNENYFYFIHSYYVHLNEEIDYAFKTDYGDISFVSLINKKNIFGTQFHPEKSGKIGLKMLRNFLTI